MYFGIESGVQEILDKCRKGINLEQAEMAFSIARKYGVVPIKGWKGFVENEEQVCWDNACKEMKDSFVFNELKNKYWEKRLSQ